jgi:hypothetical protein
MGIQFWLSMLAIWVLIYLYRDYRVDKFRFELFSLRAELFRLATSGTISFDDPVYRMLRELMNGDIRFAHRMNFVGIIILKQQVSAAIDRKLEISSIWDDAKARLPGPTFEALKQLRGRLYLYRAKQILLTSIVLQVTLVALVVYVGLAAAGRAVRNRTWDRIVNSPWCRSLCSTIDCGQLLGMPKLAK